MFCQTHSRMMNEVSRCLVCLPVCMLAGTVCLSVRPSVRFLGFALSNVITTFCYPSFLPSFWIARSLLPQSVRTVHAALSQSCWEWTGKKASWPSSQEKAIFFCRCPVNEKARQKEERPPRSSLCENIVFCRRAEAKTDVLVPPALTHTAATGKNTVVVYFLNHPSE